MHKSADVFPLILTKYHIVKSVRWSPYMSGIALRRVCLPYCSGRQADPIHLKWIILPVLQSVYISRFWIWKHSCGFVSDGPAG